MMTDPYGFHWNLYPRTYNVARAPYSFPIDGDITKAIWRDVPWSASFNDIQGKDAPSDSLTPSSTRFKCLYDDSFLYIAAELHPSPNLPTTAKFHERNSPIYQEDSDFEVFVDADSSNQNYKELEINAINTVWNLLLDKPYSDGGTEHSGRIAQPGEDKYYEVYDQSTAVKVVGGKVNVEEGATWTIELKLAFSDLYARTRARSVPKAGSFWRINFSRVEKKGLVNWTWQQQRIWTGRSYSGVVDMHQPEAWGYLHFVDNSPTDVFLDAYWPAKLTAMTIYHALRHYKEREGRYTSNLSDLNLPSDIFQPFNIKINLTGEGFEVVVTGRMDDLQVIVRDDRLLTATSIVSSQTHVS